MDGDAGAVGFVWTLPIHRCKPLRLMLPGPLDSPWAATIRSQVILYRFLNPGRRSVIERSGVKAGFTPGDLILALDFNPTAQNYRYPFALVVF
jgi:hypothetical protein